MPRLSDSTFHAAVDAHLRAAQDGWRVYEIGLQNMALAVLEAFRKEYVDGNGSLRRSLVVSFSGNRLGNLLNVLDIPATIPRKWGAVSKLVTHSMLLAARAYLLEKYDHIDPVNFRITEAWEGLDERRYGLEDLVRVEELQAKAVAAVSKTMLLCHRSINLSTAEKLRLETFIKEMAQLGTFKMPDAARPTSERYAERANRLTSSAKVAAVTRARQPAPQVPRGPSAERIDSAREEAEAGLGALVSGEADVAAVHFSNAANILAPTRVQPPAPAGENGLPW